MEAAKAVWRISIDFETGRSDHGSEDDEDVCSDE
jgi:hypothetical protein